MPKLADVRCLLACSICEKGLRYCIDVPRVDQVNVLFIRVEPCQTCLLKAASDAVRTRSEGLSPEPSGEREETA
jgi:hypothetical protein